MRRLLLCLLAFSLALHAAEVTGKWTGSFNINNSDGSTNPSTAYLDLRQNGEEVSGTAGPNEAEQRPIQKGKLEGKKLTFEVAGDEHVLKFDLSFEDDRIEGDVRREMDGRLSGTAKLAVTRVK